MHRHRCAGPNGCRRKIADSPATTTAHIKQSAALLFRRPSPDRNVNSGSQPPRITGTIKRTRQPSLGRLVGTEDDDCGGEQENDEEKQRSERRAGFWMLHQRFFGLSPPSPSGCNSSLTMLTLASARWTKLVANKVPALHRVSKECRRDGHDEHVENSQRARDGRNHVFVFNVRQVEDRPFRCNQDDREMNEFRAGEGPILQSYPDRSTRADRCMH